MKRLLLTIPLLLSTLAIGPCDPIPLGSLDGGIDAPNGPDGAPMDGSAGGAQVDASTGGAPVGGGGSGGSGVGNVGGASGGTAGGGGSSGGSAGTLGSGGSGGSGGSPMLPPACEATGWSSESVFYAERAPADFSIDVDATGALHLAASALDGTANPVAYSRCLPGGSFEWPVSFPFDVGAASPRLGVEPGGRAHLVVTGWNNRDNIYYRGMDAAGAWSTTTETAFTGQNMNPLAVRALNGDPFVLYAATGGGRGFAGRKNGSWAPGVVPGAGNVVTSALDGSGGAHLLYAAAAGLTYAVVQPDGSLATELVSPATATAVQLAIDALGGAHAAYTEAGSVRYARAGASGWVVETVPQGATAVSLRVDRAGNVHLVMTATGGLAHARRTAGTWVVDSLGPPPAGWSLAVEDNRGTVHTMGAVMTSLPRTPLQYVHGRFCMPTDITDPTSRSPQQGEWRGRSPAMNPSSRMLAGVTYDAVRNEVVLYGGAVKPGIAYVPLGDTWTLPSSGGGWVAHTGATQPGPRFQPALTFDSGRGRVVLMGDSTDTSVWEWDGVAWISRPSAAPMPALTGRVRVTYDSARALSVIWASDGIWEWNGTTGLFTARTSSPPAYVGAPTATEAAMFRDGASGHAVGFAPGKTWDWDPVTNAFTDVGVTPPAGAVITQTAAAAFAAFDGRSTWVWRRGQASWTRTTNTGLGPLPHSSASLVFDPGRGAVEVFGGIDNTVPLSGPSVYTDPAVPSWSIFSNNTDEWSPPAQ